MKKIILLIAIVFLCFIGTTKAQDAQNTVTVTDMAGREVSFRQPVKRIILIFGKEIYEFSSLLGDEIEDKLVAWGPALKTSDNDAYITFIKRFPRLQKIPFLGSYHKGTLNMEQILALKPDLVIAEVSMTWRADVINQVEKAKLPYLVLDMASDPFQGKVQSKSLLLLGKVLGKEEKAKEITDFADSHIDTIFSRLSRIKSPVPSVYIEEATSVEFYGNTHGYDKNRKLLTWGAVFGQVRCNNIAVNKICYMGQINPEYLLKADPDVIILIGSSGNLDFPTSIRLGYNVSKSEALSRLQDFTKRPGWENLQAVKNHRIYALSHEFIQHNMGFVGLEQIVKWLYPDEFKDINPEEDLQEFHNKFMPVPYNGVWMIGLEDK
ncbi:MAG: ABC transporter substrate-binding protein [bacterium]